jgi:predicted dehydrogenase
MSLWLMEGKTPVSVYARSVDKVLSKHGTKDSTFGIFTMDDGTIWSMNISWALPEVWPGSVYGIEIGIVGTKGVIDIEDTHRDLVMATEMPQGSGYRPDARRNQLLVRTHSHGGFDSPCHIRRRPQELSPHTGHGSFGSARRRS